MKFTLVKADKELFAVYQTMYSEADIEMWYDWNRRLRDTTWTDECYFVMDGDKKIGGALIYENNIINPFIIRPFTDRVAFWKFLISEAKCKYICGAMDVDAKLVPMFGYKLDYTKQVMCRPIDKLECKLDDAFECRPFDYAHNADEIANVMFKSYEGGIVYEINGNSSIEDTKEDVKSTDEFYKKNNFSHIIIEKKTNKIIGVCLSGTGENYVNGYNEIAELCVLPEYRGKGIAKYMVSKTINDSIGVSPYAKLLVHIGNNAEYLYYQMGFISGPRFSDFTLRENK